MLELLTDPQAWISPRSLRSRSSSAIDDIIFISIVSARLPLEQQPRARRIGPILALIAADPAGQPRLDHRADPADPGDRRLRPVVARHRAAAGGRLPDRQGTMETHHMLAGQHDEKVAGSATFGAVIVQILLLDIVFSLDSVIHRGRHGRAPAGDGRGRGDRHGDHAGRRRADREVRQRASDREDAGLSSGPVPARRLTTDPPTV